MKDASPGFVRKQFLVRGNLHGSRFAAAVFLLVRSLNLRGWLRPFSRGYEIQLEGDEGTLKAFANQFLSRFQQADYRFELVSIIRINPKGDMSFRLRDAENRQSGGRWVLPDRGQCSECVAEMLNPDNRRFFYPYTFCADCGPRYSIARKGLLRREDTSLGKYPLCEQCLSEVGNSRDRRFLHLVNTCPICGPSVELWDHCGVVKGRQRDALIQSAAVIEEGGVLAVKEISGFSLVCLATVNEPVRRIRALLDSAHQPIPCILQSVDAIDAFVLAGVKERDWLMQSSAPLLRIKKRNNVSSLSGQIAPFGSHFDIGLPSSGILHLLMNLLHLPLAVISGAERRLPYACTEGEALQAFEGHVDSMLVSELPILRTIPDSLVQRLGGQMQVLRHGKGIVPLELKTGESEKEVIALGGKHLTSLGLSVEERSFLLGPVGPLGQGTSLDFFFDNLNDSKALFDHGPQQLQADTDPQALTAQYALSTGTKVQQIEHDLAHVMVGLPCDFEISHVMALCFDEGIGRGKQDELSGGECLWLEGNEWQRIIQFESFCLPGGDSSIDDNRACLFGMLHETFGKKMWDVLPLKLRAQLNLQEIEQWDQVFDRKLQCRQTRSVTQWWFGLAALLLGTHRNRYQGHTFSELEAVMDREMDLRRGVKPYAHPINQAGETKQMSILGWKPMLQGIVTDMQQGRHAQYILRRVFCTFSQWILKIAATLHPQCIILSGSAFENRIWTEHLMGTLTQHGFRTQLPDQIPLNDNGLAIGQLRAASRGMNAQPTEMPSITDALTKISASSVS